MKHKQKTTGLAYPIPANQDLFGTVPVTHGEVYLWVETVARLPRSSPRFDWYVKNWAVIDKIQRIKVEFITLDNYFEREAANASHY